jgi:hypothetical protein
MGIMRVFRVVLRSLEAMALTGVSSTVPMTGKYLAHGLMY